MYTEIPPTPDHTNRQTETLCPNTGRPVHRLHGCRLSETVCLACMSKTACCGVRGSATYSDLLFDVPCCGTLNLFSNCCRRAPARRAPASAIRQLAHHLEHLDHPHGYVFLKTSFTVRPGPPWRCPQPAQPLPHGFTTHRSSARR